MKIIKLTNGYEAFVDDEDYAYLSLFTWNYSQGYAVTSIKFKELGRKQISMHRLLLKLLPAKDRWHKSEIQVDHINHHTLDNRRKNLRTCTHAQNIANRVLKARPKEEALKARSPYKGVYENSRYKINSTWIAKFQSNTLGIFETPEEAAVVYDIAIIEYFGEFAQPNFPRSNYALCPN